MVTKGILENFINDILTLRGSRRAFEGVFFVILNHFCSLNNFLKGSKLLYIVIFIKFFIYVGAIIITSLKFYHILNANAS